LRSGKYSNGSKQSPIQIVEKNKKTKHRITYSYGIEVRPDRRIYFTASQIITCGVENMNGVILRGE
jgi:hypothetical protein